MTTSTGKKYIARLRFAQTCFKGHIEALGGPDLACFIVLKSSENYVSKSTENDWLD